MTPSSIVSDPGAPAEMDGERLCSRPGCLRPPHDDGEHDLGAVRCPGCRSCADGGEVPCPRLSPEKAESLRRWERETRPEAVQRAMIERGLA